MICVIGGESSPSPQSRACSWEGQVRWSESSCVFPSVLFFGLHATKHELPLRKHWASQMKKKKKTFHKVVMPNGPPRHRSHRRLRSTGRSDCSSRPRRVWGHTGPSLRKAGTKQRTRAAPPSGHGYPRCKMRSLDSVDGKQPSGISSPSFRAKPSPDPFHPNSIFPSCLLICQGCG